MSVWDTVKYVPVNETYVVRILNSDGRLNKELKDSKLYRIHEYTFDDNDPRYEGTPGGIMIDEDIARSIIEDFRNGREGCSDLLVHCTRGEDRSPAVAIALNEIFDLGENTEELKDKHRVYTRWIYRVMMETAGLL